MQISRSHRQVPHTCSMANVFLNTRTSEDLLEKPQVWHHIGTHLTGSLYKNVLWQAPIMGGPRVEFQPEE